jgi:hypothetical protein
MEGLDLSAGRGVRARARALGDGGLRTGGGAVNAPGIKYPQGGPGDVIVCMACVHPTAAAAAAAATVHTHVLMCV